MNETLVGELLEIGLLPGFRAINLAFLRSFVYTLPEQEIRAHVLSLCVFRSIAYEFESS